MRQLGEALTALRGLSTRPLVVRHEGRDALRKAALSTTVDFLYNHLDLNVAYFTCFDEERRDARTAIARGLEERGGDIHSRDEQGFLTYRGGRLAVHGLLGPGHGTGYDLVVMDWTGWRGVAEARQVEAVQRLPDWLGSIMTRLNGLLLSVGEPGNVPCDMVEALLHLCGEGYSSLVLR